MRLLKFPTIKLNDMIEYRIVKEKNPEHADYDHYAICEIYKDRFDNPTYIGDPVEIKALSRDELLTLVSHLLEAFKKDTLKGNVLPKKRKKSNNVNT